MLRFFAVVVVADAATTPPTDNTGAYIALIGVVAAAFLTAVGGIVTAYLGKRKEREGMEGIDKSAADISTIAVAYSDCRSDLTDAQSRIRELEAELDEARSVGEFLLREITGGEHAPKSPPMEPS